MHKRDLVKHWIAIALMSQLDLKHWFCITNETKQWVDEITKWSGLSKQIGVLFYGSRKTAWNGRYFKNCNFSELGIETEGGWFYKG